MNDDQSFNLLHLQQLKDCLKDVDTAISTNQKSFSLRRARKTLGLTITEMANKLYVNADHYLGWEQESKKFPTVQLPYLRQLLQQEYEEIALIESVNAIQ